jgi:5-methylcytosine-specific restriction endonuclease McrA
MAQGHRKRNSGQRAELKELLFRGRRTAQCCFCRRPLSFESATIEHRIPLSKGGAWALENLTLSCRDCNQERGAEDFTEFRRKRQPRWRA